MDDDEVPDFELLERWRGGDRQAGDKLFSRHYDRVRAYLLGKSPPGEVADLVQTTFLGMIQSRERFDKRASFSTYLYRIARNKLADYYRKKARGKFDFDPLTHSVIDVLGPSPSHVLSHVERHQRLLDCLRQMPLATRDMLELYYWHDLTAKQLAEVIGVKPGAVKARLVKARRDLRACVGDEEPEPEPSPANEASLESQLREIGRYIRMGRV